jgi:hypothetical protein
LTGRKPGIVCVIGFSILTDGRPSLGRDVPLMEVRELDRAVNPEMSVMRQKDSIIF